MVHFCVLMLTLTVRLASFSAIWATQLKAAKIVIAQRMVGAESSPNVLRSVVDKWNMFTMARQNAQTRTSLALSVQTNAILASSWSVLESGSGLTLVLNYSSKFISRHFPRTQLYNEVTIEKNL